MTRIGPPPKSVLMAPAEAAKMPCRPGEMELDAIVGSLGNKTMEDLAREVIYWSWLYAGWCGVTVRRLRSEWARYAKGTHAGVWQCVRKMIEDGLLVICPGKGLRRLLFWSKIIFPTPKLVEKIWEHQQAMGEQPLMPIGSA